jgi:hypothetical protein
MNIQDLGAVGELVGSLAVLATLVYLAIQTRQNKILLEENQRHIRAQTYQMRTDSGREVTQLAITVPEIREFLIAREAGTEPTPEQALAFRMLMWVSFRHAENLYYQYKLGVLDEGAISGALELAESAALNPINDEIWQGRKHIHPPEFAEWMDEKIAMYKREAT